MPHARQMSIEDLIIREARFLAQQEIERELEKQGLPPPKDIETHADALVKATERFTEQAKVNVTARKDAFSEALKIIGIDNTAEAAELEFDL